MSRPALIGPARRAALLAPLVLALSASAAAAQDPAALVDAAIPHDSAISEQYQRVQAVLDEAAAAVPDTPPAPPAPAPEAAAEPAPAPPPPAEAEQYHSENVSVTQQQPSNVNVSIRINSPGDDGPVVQVNHAGGDAVVEQVVEAVERPPAAPAPGPAAPAAGGLPDTWEWVWTSACFGGAPRAGAAASATPGWSWRWSCDAQDALGADALASDLPVVPDPVAAIHELLDGVEAPAAAAPSAAASSESRPEPRPRSSAGGAGRAGRPPPPLARAAVVDANAAPVVEPLGHVARKVAARAGPGRRDGSSSALPAGTGPALGAVTALGTVASLLLGIWIAVLVTACVLVLPRIRHRRWTGPTWRLTRPPSSRLERPG